jgi:hypothetical protein
MADELEPPEAEELELDEEEGEEEDVLPVAVVLPRRLVAAVNADEAFAAELLAGVLEELEADELEVDDEDEDVLLALDEESRP